MKSLPNKKGFTLVEIMMAAGIIGLLAAIGVPYGLRSRDEAHRKLIAQELRVTSSMFIIYNMTVGTFPISADAGVVPEGMLPYLKGYPWTKETVIGGHWKWDLDQHGAAATVSIVSPDKNSDFMEKIDQAIDDGDLSTGNFQAWSGGNAYFYSVQE